MKKLITTFLLLIAQATIIYAQDNPLLKLSPFTGQWNYTETVSSSGQQDGPTVKIGTASIYFTPDSSALVVDEINEEGHRFRGIHTFDFEQQRYNNFSNRTDGGINWSHYRWDENRNRGIWYEAELIDPNHPDEKVQLNSEQLYAEVFTVDEDKHMFRVTITQPDGSKYSRKVEYTKPAWEREKERILERRKASNAALKALDEETNQAFLTDDILITTGNGTLLSGKQELKAYITSAADARPMYWIRTPKEIVVNEERGLAWETGIWHGYSADDRDGKNSLISGNYSAQWTNASGEWKIQSQLFVTIE